MVIGVACCLATCNINASPNVYAWGTGSTVPSDLTNAVQVSAGWGQFLALRSDGTVTGWGANAYGQAVDPYGLTNAVQVSAGPDVSAATLADGTIAVWGEVDPTLVFPDDLTNVVKVVACETNEFFVLRDTGEADAFGAYTNAVLYGVTDIDGEKYSVATGDSCLMASFTDGSVWVPYTFGNRNSGVIVPESVSNVVAVAASGALFRGVIRYDGTVIAWSDNTTNAVYTSVPTNNPIVQLCGGYDGIYGCCSNGAIVKILGMSINGATSAPMYDLSIGYQSGMGIAKP